MKTSVIREKFLNFFESHGHKIIESSSLIPANDKTLLFTNAGMVQFKDTFTGQEKKNYKTATTSQKCIRAGGKHNDLENVGYTLRHHTFFEMLGNFSFGDYFKSRAIKLAWDFLTDELNLPKEKLWISVYKDDDEAEKIWLEEIGVPKERIVRLGDEDNFWSMGDTGPCGPCSEIYYDHGDHIEGTAPGEEGDEGDRFVEIWNLVFMQFNRDINGKMTPLPKPSVDTGMGLERIAAVLQGVNSNYDTDLFKSLISTSEKILENKGSNSHKVLADHIRSTAFLIADGIIPENEGRGYVLRRIMRRAIRHGYKLGARKPFLYLLLDNLTLMMGSAYPQLTDEKKKIEEVIIQEEEKFFQTLETGISILEEYIKKLDGDIIEGEIAFKLHDTYGFPYDLTADIARERNLIVDLEGFNICMQKQKKASKANNNFKLELPQVDAEETFFEGYEKLESSSKVISIWKDKDEVNSADTNLNVYFVCNKTPFYAEAGGQVGDRGIFQSNNCSGQISDCKKQGKVFFHKAIINEGTLSKGDKIKLIVNKDKRLATANHHSATHLMHAALKEVLGEHVQQKGSQVDENKLRFDFSHSKPLSKQEISSIEKIVNHHILCNVEIKTKLMKKDEAIKAGAEAMFNEKYDDEVRVLTMGRDNYSVELCGGTHANRTGDLSYFIITSQSNIASGVRRIEAVVGNEAHKYINQIKAANESLQELLNTNSDSLLEKVKSLFEENKKLKKMPKSSGIDSIEVVNTINEQINKINVLIEEIKTDDTKLLRSYADKTINKISSGCAVLYCVSSDKVAIICVVTDDLIKKLSAKSILNQLCSEFNGKGGGRDDFAQGAITLKRDDNLVTSILNTVKSFA